VPQKTYRPAVLVILVANARDDRNSGVRVKRCGKSAPPLQ